jgi:hypothetical protein
MGNDERGFILKAQKSKGKTTVQSEKLLPIALWLYALTFDF